MTEKSPKKESAAASIGQLERSVHEGLFTVIAASGVTGKKRAAPPR